MRQVRKRLGSIIIAIAMIMTLLPVTAIAVQEVGTAQDLTAAAASGGEIKLTADIELDQTLSIPAGVTLTLDLAGNDIKFTNAGFGIENRGALTINDSSAADDSYGISTGCVYTTDVEAQGRHAVVNYGTLTINGGIFGDSDTDRTNDNGVQRGNALRNVGTAIIYGGAFTCCDNFTNGSGQNGNGYAYAIANGSGGSYPNASLTIHYATAYGSVNGLLASDGGKLTVEDGSYTLGDGTEDNLWRIVYTSGDGTVQLDGGTYTRKVKNNYGFFGNYSSEGDGIVINGGTFSDSTRPDGKGIYVDAGAVTITDGTFQQKLTASTSASIAVSGGTFEDTTGLSDFVQDGYTVSGNTVTDTGTRIFESGTGLQSDPYVIKTAEQLAAFRTSVNNGKTYAGQYIQLADNITLSGEWTPIGTGIRSGSSYTGDSKPFKGTFDGNKKTISGLAITANVSNVDTAIGLFGVVDGGTVRDVTLTDVSINVSNGECVGGAVGLMVNGSVVSGVEVSGTLTAVRGLGGIVGRMTVSGLVEDCVNNAKVEGTSTSSGNVGGIVGAAYYTKANVEMYIVNCQNHGAISNRCMGVGGIAGFSAANVWECTNDGSVSGNGTSIGGIVGEQQNAGSIADCQNSGTVTNGSTDTSGTGGYGTGGIVGWIRYSGDASAYARKEVVEVTGSTNTGTVSSGSIGAGGIVGMAYHAVVVKDCTNQADSITGSNMVAGIIGGMQSTDTMHPTGSGCGLTMAGNTVSTNNFTAKNGSNIGTIIGHYVTKAQSGKGEVSCTIDRGSYWTVYGNTYSGSGTTLLPGTKDIESVAVIRSADGKEWGYPTLKEAIDAVNEGETITLLAPVTVESVPLKIDKAITIAGNGESTKLTIPCSTTSRGKSLQVHADLILDNVYLEFADNQEQLGDAIELGTSTSSPADLTVQNGSVIKMENLQNGFVVPGGPNAQVIFDHSQLIADNIRGNLSNGGSFTFQNDASAQVNGCGDYGLSVNNLTVSNSTLTFTGVGISAVKTTGTNAVVEVKDNGQINVSSSGTRLSYGSKWGVADGVVDLGHGSGGNDHAADGSDIENVPATLIVESGSSIALTNNTGKEGQDVSFVYLTDMATLSNSGSITAVKMEEAAEDSYRINYMVDGELYYTAAADAVDGKVSYAAPADPTKANYNFSSWNYAGVQVTVTNGTASFTPGEANTYTFTAQWTAISTGGGGGGSTSYAVTLPTDVENGSLSVSPTRASRGRTVTITVKPDAGYELDTLTVTDKSGKAVELTKASDGKYTFTMPASQVTIGVSFQESVSPVDSFVDVDENAWYYQAVQYMVEKGLMSGTSATTFSPNTTLSRGMIAQMLYALEGKPSTQGSSFPDVASGAWYADAAAWAQANQVITGYDNGAFGPDDPLTREQLTLILYNYARLKGYKVSAQGDLSAFVDGHTTSSWAQESMTWAVGAGLLSGKGLGMLYPTGTATRAEVAQIMMNFCETVAK